MIRKTIMSSAAADIHGIKVWKPALRRSIAPNGIVPRVMICTIEAAFSFPCESWL